MKIEKDKLLQMYYQMLLIRFFEEKVALMRWVLTRANPQHVSVSVGREHSHEALEGCAIVTACYAAGKNRQGAIAILGPKRMAYRQIIPLVSRMAVTVGDILEHRELEA